MCAPLEAWGCTRWAGALRLHSLLCGHLLHGSIVEVRIVEARVPQPFATNDV
jgi:hypothetical protein